MMVLLLLLPMLVTTLWDYQLVRLRLSLDLCTYFQTRLFWKLFATDENFGRTQSAIRHDSMEIVRSAFMQCFNLPVIAGKLILFVIFVSLANPSALWVAIILPICAWIWLYFRIGGIWKLSENMSDDVNAMSESTSKSFQYYELISDYGCKRSYTEKFKQSAECANQKLLMCEHAALNNIKFAQWLAAIFFALYILLFNGNVISRQLSLGTFLAMIKLVSDLGEDLQQAVDIGIKLLLVCKPLRKVIHILSDRKDATMLSKAQYDLRQSLSLRTQRKDGDASDKLPLQVEVGMKFSYCALDTTLGETAVCDLGKWTLQVEEDLQFNPGSLISIVGPHGSGKTHVIDLFASRMVPNEGHFFHPSHLRCLHVPSDPFLIDEGLLGNLILGLPGERRKSPFELARVTKILRQLQGSSSDLEIRLQAELDDATLLCSDFAAWRQSLSDAQIATISLVRAIVMNPDLLALDSPVKHFDRSTQMKVMRMLRDHVLEKGLEMGTGKEFRRPRTVVFSTDSPVAAETADIQLFLDVSRDGSGPHGIGKTSTLRVKKRK
jgi:ABC-type multidrug transport system fused ATPase/permease subunit